MIIPAICTLLFVANEPPPNIVLIMADDLGYGDLGCYGQEQINTPRLDQLALEGMRFTDVYAGSTVCAPSRCVLMTGKDTGHAFIRGNGTMPLPKEEVTVAEVLKGSGYTTAMFGKWGLGNPGDSGEPTQQGFDEYFGYLHQGHAHNYYPEFLFRNGEKILLENVVPKAKSSGAGKASVKTTYSHDLFIQESLRFLDEHSEEPFFLYIPLTIPHANNEAGKEGMEVPDLGEYATQDWPAPQKGMAAMVSRMDAGIGEILDRLETLGVSQNTIVIFTSDNGPHREGGNNPNFFDSNGALRGIKRSLHDGGIRVPTIVRWPDRVAAGSTSSVPWMFADVLPTLADAAAQPSPAGITGQSVLATWTGKEQDLSHRTLYWEFHEGGFKQAARRGSWKAVRLTGAGKPVQLYDLGKDPGEANNIAADHSAIVSEFEAFFDTARTPSKRWPGA